MEYLYTSPFKKPGLTRISVYVIQTKKELAVKTNFGLPDSDIDELADLLNGYLSDLFVLYVKTLNFHWNIEDPRFFSLHKMLDDQYEKLQEYVDEVAERIRKLGRKVPASLRFFLDRSEFKESGPNLSANQMLAEIAEAHEKMILKNRAIIEKSDELKDPGTADMLTGILRYHEKVVWVVRAQL